MSRRDGPRTDKMLPLHLPLPEKNMFLGRGANRHCVGPSVVVESSVSESGHGPLVDTKVDHRSSVSREGEASFVASKRTRCKMARAESRWRDALSQFKIDVAGCAERGGAESLGNSGDQSKVRAAFPSPAGVAVENRDGCRFDGIWRSCRGTCF